MEPEEIREIGNVLLQEFELKHWTISIKDKFSGTDSFYMAVTNYFYRTISFSKEEMKKVDYLGCLSVIRHEIAHALVSSMAKSHGKEWKEAAFNVGLFKEELYPFSVKSKKIFYKMHVLPKN